MTKFGIALLQLTGSNDKEANVKNAINEIRRVVKEQKPRLVALPECFNAPYGEEFFDHYAEYIPNGPTSTQLSSIAKELNIYLVGGSIIERDTEKHNVLYNTATVWSPEGKLIAKHRKVHLFDIDIENVYKFTESSVLTPGKNITTFDVDGVKCGLAICFDMYFEEFAKCYRKAGVEMMFYPAAFNTVIGPMQWELLNRARANDNQFYLATISPARSPDSKYESWGYSMVSDPWGAVVKQAGTGQETIFVEIDFAQVAKYRAQIPTFNQRRLDIYDTVHQSTPLEVDVSEFPVGKPPVLRPYVVCSRTKNIGHLTANKEQ